jgi:hypothetical protein
MPDAYTKEYFTWKGVRDEMSLLAKSYEGWLNVPEDTRTKLEAMCKEAAEAMATSRRGQVA